MPNRWPWRRLWLSLLCLLPACSLRQAAVATTPDDPPTRAVAYGDHPRQRLDVYPARGRAPAPAPTLVFFYGGRWQGGNRRLYGTLARALARRGFLVIVPDTRLYPEVRFPAWVEDAARAVRWAHAHALAYGGDPGKLFVIGHSSGAYSAVLLGLDRHYLRDAGLPVGALRGVIGLAGPVDTEWTDPDVRALMGPRAGWPASYPRQFVGAPGESSPSLLLLHGGADRTVRSLNSTRLAGRLRAHGECASSRVYAGVGHVEIMAALALPWLGIAPVMRDVTAFIADPTSACAGAPAPRAD